MTVQLIHGNCLDIIPTLPDCSVDSIVTDPPYELGFMGKKWDASGIAYNITLWTECLRVLKPGGHLLAFGGTRTYHRMACAIEDAGFEIRDSIHWLYGSGFPKSLDVSKAIDKVNGEPDRLLRFTLWFREAGMTAKQVTSLLKDARLITENGTMAGHYFAKSAAGQPAIPTAAIWEVLRPHCGDIPEWVDELVARIEAEREVIGKREVPIGHSFAGPTYGGDSSNTEVDITAPATEQAKQWAGWGTALKPAHEPIVVARKPLESTVAGNVLKWGTGAINIDASRIGENPGYKYRADANGTTFHGQQGERIKQTQQKAGKEFLESTAGRWPANIILSHHEDCRQIGVRDDDYQINRLEEWSGFGQKKQPDYEASGRSVSVPVWECVPGCAVAELDQQSEGGSRFFYCAKPSRRERNTGLDGLPEKATAFNAGGFGDGEPSQMSNFHPTVKPLALMRYLVRLVTPPNGTILEPFAGSGTTLMAAVLEGFHAIGIEMTDEYLPIIEGRVAWAEQEASTQQEQLQL